MSNNEKIDSIKQCNDSMGVVYFELARVLHKINFVTEKLAQLLEGHLTLYLDAMESIDSSRECLSLVESQPEFWRPL